MAAPLYYACGYVLYFADPTAGAAALAANGGSVVLGNMPPSTAVGLYPAAIVQQPGPPGFTITGLTGVAGAIPGAFVSFYNGGAVSSVTFSPVSQLLATQSSVTVTATGSVGGAPLAPTTAIFEWYGVIVVPGTTPPASGPAPVPISGKFQIQTLQYTGDGNASKSIATNMDLTLGRVVIWIFPDVNGFSPIFRTNDTSMTGTALVGGQGLSATSGVTAFNSTGFTVSKGSDTLTISCNTTSVGYTAVVISDTVAPASASYLQVGHYTGNGILRSITGLPWSPTALWILNNDGVFRSSPEFAGDLSSDFTILNNPQTNMIKSLDANGFTLGTNAAINQNNIPFYWAALRVPTGDPARAFFDTFKFLGTGGAKTINNLFGTTTQVSGLVAAKIIDSTVPSQWRGLTQTLTASRGMDGTNNATTAITSMIANGFTVGSAFTAHNFYGWAFASTPGPLGNGGGQGPSQVVVAGPANSNPFVPSAGNQGSMNAVPQWQLMRFDIKPSKGEHL